ncbi:MAG: glycosyltransferase [Candidatus Micrarchaeota archaeon]
MFDIAFVFTQFLQGLWPLTSKLLVFSPVLNPIHAISALAFTVLFPLAVLVSAFYLIMAIASFFSSPPKKQAAFDEKKAPMISIHLPTRNELAVLLCAKSCMAFDYPKNRFEILIGDDSSNPAVSKKLKEFEKKFSKQVRVLKRETNAGFKAGNLNNMLANSSGEIIVVFDSDFAPAPDFLKRIIAPFQQDRTLSAVQARWVPTNANQNIVSVAGASILYLYHQLVLPFLSQNMGTITLCGSAEAIRKKDLDALGGWKMGSLTEDVEFSYRLFGENKRILYLSDLTCECEVPFRLKDLSRQQMRWAYGCINALQLHAVSIAVSSKTDSKKKWAILINASGYLFTVLLLGLMVLGTLSSFSNPTYPTYENVAFLLKSTAINMLLTTGFLFAILIAFLANHGFKDAIRFLAASFSVGLIVVFYVSLGIFKALAGQPMDWFLLSKNRNKIDA